MALKSVRGINALKQGDLGDLKRVFILQCLTENNGNNENTVTCELSQQVKFMIHTYQLSVLENSIKFFVITISKVMNDCIELHPYFYTSSPLTNNLHIIKQ